MVARTSGQIRMDSGHSYYAPIVPLFIITAAAKSDSLWCIRRILWNADLTSLSIVVEIIFIPAYTTLTLAASANKVAASALRVGSLFATWLIHPFRSYQTLLTHKKRT